MTGSEQGASADAGATGPPSSGAAPVARRVHRFVVPVLLVLATVIGIGATFAIWVNRQALNTSNWSSTSGKILQDKKVQTALSAYLVHELFTNVNVSADLQTVLPKQLQPLAGPAAAGLQQLAGQLAPRVLATPVVQGAWVQANIAAHKELLRVLNGGGPVVSTRSGVVSLNLHTLVSQLAATVGLSSQVAAVQSKLQGSTGATVRAAAQAKLGVTLPPASGQLVIMRSNELKTAQDVANAVKHLAIVLPALGILLFALAVYLARGRRRRTLRTTGWCFVLIGVALLLIRRVAGDAVVNGLVKIPSNKPAAHQVWNIGTSLLRDIAVAMIVYGIVIVASAWLAGPTRPATEIRKALAPSLRDSPAVAYCIDHPVEPRVAGLHRVLREHLGPVVAQRGERGVDLGRGLEAGQQLARRLLVDHPRASPTCPRPGSRRSPGRTRRSSPRPERARRRAGASRSATSRWPASCATSLPPRPAARRSRSRGRGSSRGRCRTPRPPR